MDCPMVKEFQSIFCCSSAATPLWGAWEGREAQFYERCHELVATLERPGLVILADAYYPGWTLTVDGQLAPIYRTNRLMRGAAVKARRCRNRTPPLGVG